MCIIDEVLISLTCVILISVSGVNESIYSIFLVTKHNWKCLFKSLWTCCITTRYINVLWLPIRQTRSFQNPDCKVHGGQHGGHLGPVGPRWAPCWPHEPCYQGSHTPHNLNSLEPGWEMFMLRRLTAILWGSLPTHPVWYPTTYHTHHIIHQTRNAYALTGKLAIQFWYQITICACRK